MKKSKRTKNYDTPNASRVCQNPECCSILKPHQKVACSAKCWAAIKSDRAAVWFICQVCGKKFSRPRGAVKSQIKQGKGPILFCSSACRNERIRKKPNASVICGGCGLPIDLNKRKKSYLPKYHNRICMAIAFKGQKRPYIPMKHEVVEQSVSNARLNEAFDDIEGIIM